MRRPLLPLCNGDQQLPGLGHPSPSPSTLFNGLPAVPGAVPGAFASTPAACNAPQTIEQHILEAQAKADRQAAERARQIEEAREERERKKNDPVCKAERLAAGIQKEAASVHCMLLDVQSSRATKDQKAMYQKKFAMLEADLQKCRDKLLKATLADAEALMEEATTFQQAAKDGKAEVKMMQKLADKGA